MPVTVEMLPNEPVIVATLYGRITTTDTADLINICADLTQHTHETIYRITDLTDAEIALPDMMPVINTIAADLPASIVDPRFQSVFVGNARTSRMYADIICRQVFSGDSLPFFRTVDEAKQFIQGQRAQATA